MTSNWCRQCDMKVNQEGIKSMIISLPRHSSPAHDAFFLEALVFNEFYEAVVPGANIDSKSTFFCRSKAWDE